MDAARAPVPNAELQLARTGEPKLTIRAGADGRFSFPGVADGQVEISVRRLGYRARSLSVDIGAEREARALEILLDAISNQLEEVNVIGQNSRLREFYQRRKQRSAGRFFTQQEIEKLAPRFSSDLFRTVPGAALRTARVGSAIRLRGCRPKVWIDGIPIRDVELDEVMTPSEIAGLEVYSSAVGIPPEYMDHTSQTCGAILVWTRLQ